MTEIEASLLTKKILSVKSETLPEDYKWNNFYLIKPKENQ